MIPVSLKSLKENIELLKQAIQELLSNVPRISANCKTEMCKDFVKAVYHIDLADVAVDINASVFDHVTAPDDVKLFLSRFEINYNYIYVSLAIIHGWFSSPRRGV